MQKMALQRIRISRPLKFMNNAIRPKKRFRPGFRSAAKTVKDGLRHIAGEALRRADGRMPGRFIAEEIAGPLGLDLHVGLGSDQDHRVAGLVAGRDVDDWIEERKRTGYHSAHLRPPITALTPNHGWRVANPAANFITPTRCGAPAALDAGRSCLARPASRPTPER